jgi:hypothetical protein
VVCGIQDPRSRIQIRYTTLHKGSLSEFKAQITLSTLLFLTRGESRAHFSSQATKLKEMDKVIYFLSILFSDVSKGYFTLQFILISRLVLPVSIPDPEDPYVFGPDPYFICMDPTQDPSTNKQKSEEKP